MFIGFAWSGLGTSLKAPWQYGVNNCNSWSSSESSIIGNMGYEDYSKPSYALSSYQLYQGDNPCNQNQSSNLPIGLICVQQ